jgi:hypothetical protein
LAISSPGSTAGSPTIVIACLLFFPTGILFFSLKLFLLCNLLGEEDHKAYSCLRPHLHESFFVVGVFPNFSTLLNAKYLLISVESSPFD